MKCCLIITLTGSLNTAVTLIIILSLVIQKCCRILLLIVFFIKYKELSNVSNMNLHGFRHSHATMMLEITNDVYNVSKRLGHENIEITDTYLHVNNKLRFPGMKTHCFYLCRNEEKIEDVIKSEEKNKIEDYLYDLKVSLKMQMTKGSYSKKDIRKLKKNI